MNRSLLAPFTGEEVRRALFQMGPFKAPGMDGFPAHFYQKFWSTVGNDVTQVALHFLNNNGDLKDINETWIVLIPKNNHPENFTQFRPISLYNVCYKIISKVIANRLKVILSDIISINQSVMFLIGKLQIMC